MGCGNQVEGNLKWWQLSLIGVGCIIGTGYFLGSSIAIKFTGPSVLIVFLLAACSTFIVFDALAKMSAQDPQKGSFRSYAKKAFGGIEVMGIMTIRLKNKEDAPKAGRSMLFLLTTIYVLSLALAVCIVPFHHFHENHSPFITALETYHLPFFPHVFNGAMIIAGFSTMSPSFFSVTTMIVTLSEDGDAPSFFSKKKGNKLQFPLPAQPSY